MRQGGQRSVKLRVRGRAEAPTLSAISTIVRVTLVVSRTTLQQTKIDQNLLRGGRSSTMSNSREEESLKSLQLGQCSASIVSIDDVLCERWRCSRKSTRLHYNNGESLTVLVEFAMTCNLLEVVVLLTGCVNSQNTLSLTKTTSPLRASATA